MCGTGGAVHESAIGLKVPNCLSYHYLDGYVRSISSAAPERQAVDSQRV